MALEFIQRVDALGGEYHALSSLNERCGIAPLGEHERFKAKVDAVVREAPHIDSVSSERELLLAEASRHLITLQVHNNSPHKPFTFEEYCIAWGLVQEDFTSHREFLITSKENLNEAIVRRFENGKAAELGYYSIQIEERSTLEEALDVTEEAIARVHGAFAHYAQQYFGLNRDFKSYSIVPKSNSINGGRQRSHFNSLRKVVELDIERFCYVDSEGKVQVDYSKFLEVYGHEVLGHCIQHLYTQKEQTLQPLQRRGTSTTIATDEALAIFSEGATINSLDDEPMKKRLKRALRGKDVSETREETRIQICLADHRRRHQQYGIYLLTQLGLEDPKNRKYLPAVEEELNALSVEPFHLGQFINYFLHNGNETGVLLTPNARECLKYASSAVNRAWGVFHNAGYDYANPKDRRVIDHALYAGHWTPQGLVERAQLIIKGKMKQ